MKVEKVEKVTCSQTQSKVATAWSESGLNCARIAITVNYGPKAPIRH